MLDTFRMVVAAFSVTNKANWARLFEETFLVANVSLEVVLEIPFLILSGADIDFLGRELRWKTYTTKKALSTTKRIELVDKREFVATALDPEHETYVVYVGWVNFDTSSSSSSLDMPQISGLIVKEAPTKDSVKYSDFANVLCPNLAFKLPENTRINKYAIKLVNSYQQLPTGLSTT